MKETPKEHEMTINWPPEVRLEYYGAQYSHTLPKVSNRKYINKLIYKILNIDIQQNLIN